LIRGRCDITDSAKETDTNDFDGLISVVTGGASGIGAATAALLSRRGARLAVLDRGASGVPSTAPAMARFSRRP
jgi:NAD(P)-dependent dehydrogenase (short-subunit alcohol dehydrogenase family)